MKEIEKLYDRIIQRVNINLRELEFDVNPYVQKLIPFVQMVKFYAFYGISPHHPLNFQFRSSNLAGSYFLGRCKVTNSLLYKSDIRGDELKKKGSLFRYQDYEVPVSDNEEIDIQDSLLIHGHAGFCDEHPFQQMLRDIVGFEMISGTEQMLKLIISHEAIGPVGVPDAVLAQIGSH